MQDNSFQLIGSFIQCIHPYPRSVEECDVYEAVTCHFLYGQGIGSDEESFSKNQSSPVVGLSVSCDDNFFEIFPITYYVIV